MQVRLIPDNGNGVTVNAPASIKRVGCETHCPKCKHMSRLVSQNFPQESRRCDECKLMWHRGTWCYLVEFAEPEAKS